ncbi:hypothetical protein GCM10007421_34070 [Halopseudomonas oceani]|nr:hypothetical protein [Halopseudomonas oceani]GGE56672.1 hypothetical protein GCM10007421_34070 [Halopseudomonas oceani]
MVKVYYQCREKGTELVNHERELAFYREAYEVIDNYLWAEELAFFEELGEGGGFLFVLGDLDDKYASYQLIPSDVDRGVLLLDVVCKKGVMSFLGRKSISVDFDLVSISEAKRYIKELFEGSIESLYEKHKK